MTELLPDELLRSEDGHASDVALTALADGESAIVPTSIKAHVEACSRCSGHLGHAALLSLRSGLEIRPRLQRAEKAKKASAPSPLRAMFLGLALALLGALPRLIALPGDLAVSGTSPIRGYPLLLRGMKRVVFAAANALAGHGPLLSAAAAAVLLACAFLVLYAAPRPTGQA